MPNLYAAGKLRAAAEALTPKIEHARRPMTQNPTPKRSREYQSRLHDARNMERCQHAMLALADAWERDKVPPALEKLRRRSEIEPLVRKGLIPSGYYEVIEDENYADTSPAGRELQLLLELWRDQRIGDGIRQQEQADRVLQLEQSLVGLNIPDFFPTPRPVIDMMLERADVETSHAVLEPSAGKGDIADAVRELKPQTLGCLEIHSRLREILEAKEHRLLGSNFLEFSESDFGLWDRIVMNPPFSKGQDIDHVRHAAELLCEGGRLVSLISVGPLFRSDRKSEEFRRWLDEVGAEVEQLPEKAFTGAGVFRQTGVQAAIVTVSA